MADPDDEVPDDPDNQRTSEQALYEQARDHAEHDRQEQENLRLIREAAEAIRDYDIASRERELWYVDRLNPEVRPEQQFIDAERQAHTEMLGSLARLSDDDAKQVLSENPRTEHDGSTFTAADIENVRRFRDEHAFSRDPKTRRDLGADTKENGRTVIATRSPVLPTDGPEKQNVQQSGPRAEKQPDHNTASNDHAAPSNRRADDNEAPVFLEQSSLRQLIQEFRKVRDEANLPRTQTETAQFQKIRYEHNAEREALQAGYGRQLTPEQQEQNKRLDHRQLAERTSLEATWLAQRLDAKGSPDAKTFFRDARDAKHTAQLVQKELLSRFKEEPTRPQGHPHQAPGFKSYDWDGLSAGLRHDMLAQKNQTPEPQPPREQLADKLAKFNEKQQQRYQSELARKADNNEETTEAYKLRLATTLLKNLPEREEGREIKEIGQQENRKLEEKHSRQRNLEKNAAKSAQATERNEKPASDAARESAAPQRDKAAETAAQRRDANDKPTPNASRESTTINARQPDKQVDQPKADNSLEGVKPNAPPRDYAKLQETHAQVSQAQVNQGAQFGQASTILSRERLATIQEFFPEIRREAALLSTQAERNERNELTIAQEKNATKLEQQLGPTADPQLRLKALELQDHQHLAEHIFVQAKWVARGLKAQKNPDADIYENYKTDALNTARELHDRRENLFANSGRGEDRESNTRTGRQQKQSDEQAPARDGVEPTSEQRTHSEEKRSTIDRPQTSIAKERASARDHPQSPQMGGNAGSGKSGGRGR